MKKSVQSGLHNYEGCRIQVNNDINNDFLRRMLGSNYNVLIVCDLFKYGFPIGILEEGFQFDQLDTWKYRNHSGF
jgi:hypothetical protein